MVDFSRMDEAHDYFNKALFQGKLKRPEFKYEAINRGTANCQADPSKPYEITFHPAHYPVEKIENPDVPMLATLVHEMAHRVEPPEGILRSIHHGPRWRALMKYIGLPANSHGAYQIHERGWFLYSATTFLAGEDCQPIDEPGSDVLGDSAEEPRGTTPVRQGSPQILSTPRGPTAAESIGGSLLALVVAFMLMAAIVGSLVGFSGRESGSDWRSYGYNDY